MAFSFRCFLTCYGSEFVSRDLDLWAYRHGVTLDFSRPGKPLLSMCQMTMASFRAMATAAMCLPRRAAIRW